MKKEMPIRYKNQDHLQFEACRRATLSVPTMVDIVEISYLQELESYVLELQFETRAPLMKESIQFNADHDQNNCPSAPAGAIQSKPLSQYETRALVMKVSTQLAPIEVDKM